MKQTNKALKAKIAELEQRLQEDKTASMWQEEKDCRACFLDRIKSDNNLETVDGLEDAIRELGDSDIIHEVVDGCVPVYNSTLLELAANTPDLALNEPELGPAFDGSATPINIIAANVFEALEADIYEYAKELEVEFQEKLDALEAVKV